MNVKPDGKQSLRMRFQGRVIDHLGIQMYQSPVAALAELVANAWDADAEAVSIYLPEVLDSSACIRISDAGIGMSHKDCEDRYLNIGWDRRSGDASDASVEKGRPVLGRKGIGKFAGFGIADVIRVETISKETGEKTVFELDIRQLRSGGYVRTNGTEIAVIEYLGADESRRAEHGTVITLKGLKLKRRIAPEQFRRSMARRFLLHQRAADFKVLVNGTALPVNEDLEAAEFVFPRDYRVGQRPKGLSVVEGWGEETLPGGRRVRWRIVFYETPIDEEELRGVTIFSRGKLAQTPFFFNLSGGLGGQHGQAYMSGQVEADYIDQLGEDIIATERQRINWEHEAAESLLAWGQERIKDLLRIWHDRRGEKNREQIEQKVATFLPRLQALPPHERRTIKSALDKLGAVPTLNSEKFRELAEAVLLAWEQGQLHDLIDDISKVERVSEVELLEILLEAQVLTALNTAEAVKTKLLTVGGLKLRIRKQELEGAVRDYIAKNPWLISPEWDTFRVETSVENLKKAAVAKAGIGGSDWAGRVDLALSSGDHLLIMEFMRPGLRLDWDHISRFERYIRSLRTAVRANTGGRFRVVTGYIVADKLGDDPDILGKIEDMAKEGMRALDWDTLLGTAVSAWKEFLGALANRAPRDERLAVLLER